MTNSGIKNTEFKFGKSALLLFLFQTSVGIAIAFALYIFPDLVKLLPATMGDGHSVGTAAIICGSSLWFGQWMEKRYPGMLNKKRIKKLSIWCTLMNCLLGILIVSALIYPDSILRKPISFAILGMAVVFMAIIMIMVYFSTKFFIAHGIKSCKPKKVKLQ